MPTATLAHQALQPDVLATYKQALGVLQTIMADVATHPKEALQAAKLVVQKINPKLWFALNANVKRSVGTSQPLPAPSDAELLGELAALDAQLARLLDANPRITKKKTPKWDKFSKLPNPHKA